MLGIKGTKKEPKMANTLITQTICQIWEVRNNVTFNDKDITPVNISARKILKKFQNTIKMVHLRLKTKGENLNSVIDKTVASEVNGEVIFHFNTP